MLRDFTESMLAIMPYFKRMNRLKDLIAEWWPVFGPIPVSLALIVCIDYGIKTVRDAFEIDFVADEVSYLVAICLSLPVTCVLFYPERFRRSKRGVLEESKTAENESSCKSPQDRP